MADADSKAFVLTDYARKVIDYKAWQLSQRRDFSSSDKQDLAQDFWQAVVSQADRFDPSRASVNTFIDRVVASAAAMAVRDRQRKIRAKGFHAISLDAAPADGDRARLPLAATITEDDRWRHIGQERPDDIETNERDVALGLALDSMPPEVSDVCRRVMNGSILASSKQLKTSRRQIRNALAIARTHLESVGIDHE
jgi:DNA-directed RNA polymerase specialized sigma24 family protein